MMSHDLKELLKLIFDTAFDPEYDDCFGTINELAEVAGLAWLTVDRLYRRQTRFPRYDTIVKLAKAVGFDVKLMMQELDDAAV
jgi:hypothetical protein